MTRDFTKRHPGLVKQIKIIMQRLLQKLLQLKSQSGKINLSNLDKTECLSDIETIIDENLSIQTSQTKGMDPDTACHELLTEIFRKLNIPGGNTTGYVIALTDFNDYVIPVESEYWLNMFLDITPHAKILQNGKPIKYNSENNGDPT